MQKSASGRDSKQLSVIQRVRPLKNSCLPKVTTILKASTAPFHRYGTTSAFVGGWAISAGSSTFRRNMRPIRVMQDTQVDSVAARPAPYTFSFSPAQQTGQGWAGLAYNQLRSDLTEGNSTHAGTKDIKGMQCQPYQGSSAGQTCCFSTSRDAVQLGTVGLCRHTVAAKAAPYKTVRCHAPHMQAHPATPHTHL
jgi:hypothetical protein